ncbi:MAG: ornithine carbamoyltransferase [Oligoflexia bacterium]|nr:ornithine carbamoyltransferase [Oligoflexia bacterium]
MKGHCCCGNSSGNSISGSKNNCKKDFIHISDYSSEELEKIISLAEEMKRNPHQYRESLKGKSLGMIFSKNSTRTRISFEVGIFQLGGMGLYFGANDLQLSRGETVHDTGKVLARYLDGIMIRTFAHNDVTELAKYASIPVINGLTDYNHPCQAMADIMTIKEKFGTLKGLKLAYVGDGNNVVRSLAHACIKFGLDVSIVTPKNYAMEEGFIVSAQQLANSHHKTKVLVTDDIKKGVDGANVVYTDTFTSMGQEAERERRLRDLKDYQVNDQVMSYANRNAIFMHCLPCHRGEEVTASVIDGPQSAIFDEAENRLHAQKAIMYMLMK